MRDSQWSTLVELLEDSTSIEFDAGLSDEECASTEARFGFTFPRDLRDFLQTALPISPHFPNWRSESDESLQKRLDLPLRGILFDVEHNDVWIPEWGTKPASLEEACQHVRQLVADAPTLIPVYTHRMIPDRPNDSGNPVFSVHQTDVIYYGLDLRDYLIHEFLVDSEAGLWPTPDQMREIEFWDVNRFQEIRWANERQGIRFDNRDGILP